jgi:hypothetical protein
MYPVWMNLSLPKYHGRTINLLAYTVTGIESRRVETVTQRIVQQESSRVLFDRLVWVFQIGFIFRHMY